MQFKINAFFKPLTLNDPEPPALFDDISAPDSSETQEILVTYNRRIPKFNAISKDDNTCESVIGQQEQLVYSDSKLNDQEVSCVEPASSSVKSTCMGRIHKKRSYAQYHLELGQSDFLLHTCSICGLKYARGDEDDERLHKAFHMNYYHGIQFKGWHKERIVHTTSSNGDRIILVLDGDPPAHRHKVEEVVKVMEGELGLSDRWLLHKLCKVYLVISKHRIIGCLVAEPIKNAYRVVSSSVVQKNSDVTKGMPIKSRPTKLQFGSVCFRREVIRKPPSTMSSPDIIDVDEKGAVFCENEAVSASCGIRAIWVAPSSRRKHVATELLDALRQRRSGPLLE